MNTHSTDKALYFMKWHGAGNDFVIIDSRGSKACVTQTLAREIGDRHKGVGFDQLAEIRDSASVGGADSADIDLDFWNSDGSRAGACGNATRCVARFIMDDTGVDALTIRTTRGLLYARREGGEVSVNMGQPQLAWADVPLSHDVDLLHLPIAGDPAAIGMGNPHCVFFVDDLKGVDVAGLGTTHEHHALFSQATNVEFVQVIAPDEIYMRVWERGAGITLACGSGACASVVAGASRGLIGRKVRVRADGGILVVDWREDGVWLSGPTAHVFDAMLKPGAFVGL